MANTPKKSLLLRVSLAMTSIIMLAFVSMVSSVFTVETTSGEASAINQAGSLRMQTFRITANIEARRAGEPGFFGEDPETQILEFDDRLHSAKLVNVLPYNTTLRDAHEHLVREWQTEIKPALYGYLRAHPDTWLNHDRNPYLTRIEGFVLHIDQFVKLLEQDAESKIKRLRIIQVTTLFLTLGVVFITLYLMHVKVAGPLRDLLACAQSARQGDFSVRATHSVDDELGQLGYAFNLMAEDISRTYADLEERVRQKTGDLERSNRSLELLYKTITRLNQAPVSDQTYKLLLQDIEQPLGLGPSAICLANSNGGNTYTLASTFPGDTPPQHLCRVRGCSTCFDGDLPQLFDYQADDQSITHMLSIPIKDREHHRGILITRIPAGASLQDWQRRLLEAIAQHIGLALETSARLAEGRRLALLEERSVIARELHDSLAQSLSYLKIQVARLQASLVRRSDDTRAAPIIEQLREGISAAYRQLRELLTTFRLSMDDRGLRVALEKTVAEFRERSDLDLALTYRLGMHGLSVHQEIHLHQLIREAVANVVQHAQARHAQILLFENAERSVQLVIDDDGIGIPDAAERTHHYGLAIMQERARSLGATLQVTRKPTGGTRVELTIPRDTLITESTEHTGHLIQ